MNIKTYFREIIFTIIMIILVVIISFVMFSCSKDKIEPNYPKIGDTYQGGTIFYIFKSGDFYYVKGEFHGLIVADYNSISIWGCSSVQINDIPGNLGGGEHASENIVGKCSGNSAAKLCLNLSYNGYSNWYLPNKKEFNELVKSNLSIFNSSSYWVAEIGYSINPYTGIYTQYPISDVKSVKPIRRF